MKSKLIFCLVALGTLAQLAHAQSAVARPTWSENPYAGGGLTAQSVAVPSEYVGGETELAKEQFPGRGWLIESKLCSVRFSPTSGVIQFEDLRVSPATITGWDTGYDRVYSCILENNTSTSVSYVCTVWDSTKKKSRVIRITLGTTGTFSQTKLSIWSKKLSIWCAASVVDSHLYIFNIQTLKISRYSDANSDGKYDTKDTAFGLTIPTTDPELETDLDITTAIPLRGFKRLGTEHATLIGPPETTNEFTRGMYIENDNGSYSLKTKLPYEPKLLSLHATELVVNQNCIFVTGPAGVEFTVEATLPNASVIQLAVAQIQLDGVATVMLSQPLVAGWKVQAKTSVNGVRFSSIETVSSEDISVLFRPHVDSIYSNEPVRLFGDKLSSAMTGKCKDKDGNIHSVTIVRVNDNEICATFPQFGTGTGQPPFNKMKLVTFWLVDASTNVRTSNFLEIYVRHN